MGVGQDGQINGWAAIFDEIDDLEQKKKVKALVDKEKEEPMIGIDPNGGDEEVQLGQYIVQ